MSRKRKLTYCRKNQPWTLTAEQVRAMPDHVDVPTIPDDVVKILKKMQANIDDHGDPLSHHYADDSVIATEWNDKPLFALMPKKASQ